MGIMLPAIIPIGQPITPAIDVSDINPQRAAAAKVHEKTRSSTQVIPLGMTQVDEAPKKCQYGGVRKAQAIRIDES